MKFSSSLTIIFLISIMGCYKNENLQKQDKFDFSEFSRPNGSMSGFDYCKECGTSTNKESYCHRCDGYSEWVCEVWERGCNVILINEMADAYNLSFDLLDEVPECHTIRDSLLMWSMKGRSYNSYYDLLSQYALESNLITLENVYDYYTFAVDVKETAGILMMGESAEIPVTTSFRNKAQNFIDNYRIQNPQIGISNILDSIEHDLENFEGLTNAQIRTIIYVQ